MDFVALITAVVLLILQLTVRQILGFSYPVSLSSPHSISSEFITEVLTINRYGVLCRIFCSSTCSTYIAMLSELLVRALYAAAVVVFALVRALLLVVPSDEPLVLLLPRRQRRFNKRNPSPSHTSSTADSTTSPTPSSNSVTQQRRERRAEKIERKRNRKRQSLVDKLSSLYIGDTTISIDAFGTCSTSTNSKADGLACSGMDSSATTVSTITTTTTITTSTITTHTVTTLVATCSDLPPPPTAPAVLAFFNGKPSFMLRPDFHLYGNITNKFLFEKCILQTFSSILLNFKKL